MGYRRDLWEIAAQQHGVVTVREAEEEGVPAVEVRKLAHRGALEGYGRGVYVHGDIPADVLTQPAVAVALAGEGAFLHREAVFDAMGLGQFNPRWIHVGTKRRVRRMLPEWMKLEYRAGMGNGDLTRYENIPVTTVRRALLDVANIMPPDRWWALLYEAHRREFLEDAEVEELKEKAERGEIALLGSGVSVR